jgi:hypothetical protein
MRNNFNELSNLFGYCPQFDAIFEFLTVYENLKFYGQIKGIKEEYLEKVINALISEMSLNEFVTKFEMEITINNENKYASGIGVLCNIPSKNIKALITFNHLMNLDFLNNGQKILLYINKKEYEINIKKVRYFYTTEEFDITIIEILDDDCVKNFIEIDKFINSKNYIDEDIICISLTKNKKINFSYGNIIEKKDDYYKCDIEPHNEGIIILKDNMKLIGIIHELNMIPIEYNNE